MKRILHIVGAMQRGGAETLLMNLFRSLDRNKYQFDFLYFTSQNCAYDDEIESLGGKIYRIESESNNKLFQILNRYINYFRLLKKLPNHQIIHSHINLNGAVFLLIAYLQQKRLRIAHSHTSDRKMSLKERFFYSISTKMIKISANIFLACGDSAAKYLYPKITRDEIVLLPNSIDIANFQKKDYCENYLRNKLNLDKDIKILSQIGSFTSIKNHIFTINFAKYLQNTNEKVHVVFVGGGPLEHELKKKVKDQNLSKYITFYGSSKEIPKIMHSSDLLFMPSIAEGFPVVLVEAQACGLPCLISNNISKEVDLELNLIAFADLTDDFSVWKNKLNNAFSRKSKDLDTIKKVLKSKHFDAVDSVQKLQDIYSK